MQWAHNLPHFLGRGSFYPGTGKAQEVGAGQGQGYTVNIPWDCGGMGDDDYIAAFQHVILPIAKEYGPDMTILSAGFDAAEGDPLGMYFLQQALIAYSCRRCPLSIHLCGCLKGGYHSINSSFHKHAIPCAFDINVRDTV